MTAEELLERAGSDDLARLRWHLCGVAGGDPCSSGGRSWGFAYCPAGAARRVLARPGTAAQVGERNPNFDGAVFIRRKGAGV